MTWIKQLFGIKTFSGAAHHGTKPVMFTEIYREGRHFFFTWYRADHTEGEVLGPFINQEMAELAKDQWSLNPRVRGLLTVAVGR